MEVQEALPKYIMEERALTAKFQDDIYVIVTRGEKKSKGYFVDMENIVMEEYGENKYDLVVYAKFIDPNPNEIVTQEYDYPIIVVKTDLKDMPQAVHLDIEYVEWQRKNRDSSLMLRMTISLSSWNGSIITAYEGSRV